MALGTVPNFQKKIELQSKFLKYDQPHDLRDVPNSLKLISQLSAVPVYKVLQDYITANTYRNPCFFLIEYPTVFEDL